MNLGPLVVLLKLFQDSGIVSPPPAVPAGDRELMIGEYCPQENTRLPKGAICVNNRVMPKLD